MRIYFINRAARDFAVAQLEQTANEIKAQNDKEKANPSNNNDAAQHVERAPSLVGQGPSLGKEVTSPTETTEQKVSVSTSQQQLSTKEVEKSLGKKLPSQEPKATEEPAPRRKPPIVSLMQGSTHSDDETPSPEQNEEKTVAPKDSSPMVSKFSTNEEEKNAPEIGDKSTTLVSKKKGPVLSKFRAAALAVKQDARTTRATSTRKFSTVFEKLKEMVATECKIIDDYAPDHYGIECAQRLFWKTFVADQDITRTKEQQTGRPSTPGFQDANMYSLATGMKEKTDPLPVLLQTSCDDPEAAMKPQSLVMAYEENKKVVPVVSDFDGFLLGWRREALWFGCDLPREQEDLMLWCVSHIESILDSPTSTESWTSRWLDILKKEKKKGFHPEIPPYGFGDPKSYAIMENAALRLIDTGAVRHGSECFNYFFPQEIDDMFLVISDTLSPVPWKYVDVVELQQILSDRIDDGFVFPLNPKWLLCDPGWYGLYKKLLASDALYADLSKDVWFPPHSGVREKIDELHQRHPNGFQRRAHSYNGENLSNMAGTGKLSGQAEAELAELELANYDADEAASEEGHAGIEEQTQRRRGRRRNHRSKSEAIITRGVSNRGVAKDGQAKRKGLFGRFRGGHTSSEPTASGNTGGRFGGIFGRRRSTTHLVPT